MASPRSAFPLRLSDPRVRAAVREVAEHEHVSQNEYIERAVINDLALRGTLRAEQLAASAARLATLSAEQHSALIERSLVEFAAGEALPDPLAMRSLSSAATASAKLTTRLDGPLAAVAAFRAR